MQVFKTETCSVEHAYTHRHDIILWVRVLNRLCISENNVGLQS